MMKNTEVRILRENSDELSLCLNVDFTKFLKRLKKRNYCISLVLKVIRIVDSGFFLKIITIQPFLDLNNMKSQLTSPNNQKKLNQNRFRNERENSCFQFHEFFFSHKRSMTQGKNEWIVGS